MKRRINRSENRASTRSRAKPYSIVLVVFAISGLATAGCADSAGPAGSGQSAGAKPAAAPVLPPPKIVEAIPEPPPAEVAESPPPAQPEPEVAQPPPPSGSIIGKKTDDVRDAEKEKAAGAKVKKPRITGNDPITVTGSAYSAIIGRTEQLRMKHQLDLWANLNGRYPRDFDEFKREIIDATGIRLTQLPYYQKYGYNAQTHELLILEYPHE